jgi:hypothetical protein
LTSSALGIAQQLVVEKIAPRNPPPSLGGSTSSKTGSKKGDILVKQVAAIDGADAKAPAFGKGKARV